MTSLTAMQRNHFLTAMQTHYLLLLHSAWVTVYWQFNHTWKKINAVTVYYKYSKLHDNVIVYVICIYLWLASHIELHSSLFFFFFYVLTSFLLLADKRRENSIEMLLVFVQKRKIFPWINLKLLNNIWKIINKWVSSYFVLFYSFKEANKNVWWTIISW